MWIFITAQMKSSRMLIMIGDELAIGYGGSYFIIVFIFPGFVTLVKNVGGYGHVILSKINGISRREKPIILSRINLMNLFVYKVLHKLASFMI